MHNFVYKVVVVPKGTRKSSFKYFRTLEGSIEFATSIGGLRLVHRDTIESGFSSMVGKIEGMDQDMLSCFRRRMEGENNGRVLDVQGAAPTFNSGARGKLLAQIKSFPFAIAGGEDAVSIKSS